MAGSVSWTPVLIATESAPEDKHGPLTLKEHFEWLAFAELLPRAGERSEKHP